MGKFIYKSACEIAVLIRVGKASSVEVVQEHLDQIKQHNPSVNAVILLMEDEALIEAAACDAEAKEGRFRGPLHGVPMTIKEQFWVKGSKSTLNTNRNKDWIAPEDAVIVSRLKEAGAIIIGKTNIAKDLLDYQVNGDIYPEGKNPYNTDYSPGGSSGGSAAALASGMVPVELGGDFGGSIRVPSNFCGLYGLKPTESVIPGHGQVPKSTGSKSFVFHMATSGPMARVPEDLELIWKVIVGPHKSDRATPRIEWKEPKARKLSDYKIAWVDEWPEFDTSRQTKKYIKNFIDLLKDNGCKPVLSPPPNNLHDRTLDIHRVLSLMLISQEVPPLIKPFMMMGLKKTFLKGIKGVKWKMKDSLIGYSEIMGKRAKVISEWEQYFEDYDFLVCPMGYGPAMKRCKMGTPITYDGRKITYLNYVWPFNACFNASGHPAITIPMGIGVEGLPMGIQVVGPYWSEPELIHFAKIVSEFTPGFVRPKGF